MDKRQFLKTSAALVTGSLLSSFPSEAEQTPPRTNWAGNYTFRAEQLYRPNTVKEVQQVVRGHDKLKALGARHSFNSIADSPGGQVSLEHLNQMTVDAKSRTVTVGAGVRYGQLAPYLDQNGFALHNLASLPHVSVAGACATATHGSGSKNGNLSTAVAGLEIVNGKGEVVTLTRQDKRFQGAVVGLGALGIITNVTLNLQPTFQMRQVVYENLSFDKLEHHLDEIFATGYSLSLFTDWQNHRATQVWIKSKVAPGSSAAIAPEFFGAKAATRNLHPLAGHSAENCTEQMGVPGPWYERMPHFKMNFTPSSGQELQTEYFVPRNRAYEAILAVEKLRDHITPHLFITELRAIESDSLWISPCYSRPAVAIHFTWKPEWDAVKTVLPKIEEQLQPFDARPHWAKLFTMSPSRLQTLYGRMPEFQQLALQFDLNGKFRNEFLTTNIF
jgi:alditol oxidase